MQPTTPHIYQEIAESLRLQIAAGDLQPGERLPPIREMAQRWHCTPGTVSRAYAILADDGLVTGRRGSGTHVVENPLPGERPFMAWATLVNRAEQFLLEALSSGHSTAQAQAALTVAVARWQTLQADPIPPATHTPYTALRFAGSHDLAVELLAQTLHNAQQQEPLVVQFMGSLGGLMALARGEADMAGIHLWDVATDQYNAPFVRRLLPGQRVVLLTLVQRDLGLIVPPGNPQGLATLADLTHPDIRWMNRQVGSGTRVWLDAQLKALAINVAAIAGYTDEVTTHMLAAQAVATGKATAVPGIYAAAAAYGLDFVPLTQELYQLVIPEQVWETAVCQSLVTAARSPAFREAVNALGGYDTSATGTVTWL
ncbi:MAG: substrate-binding domain-containing protein [Chloroflexota bacterium]